MSIGGGSQKGSGAFIHEIYWTRVTPATLPLLLRVGPPLPLLLALPVRLISS